MKTTLKTRSVWTFSVHESMKNATFRYDTAEVEKDRS